MRAYLVLMLLLCTSILSVAGNHDSINVVILGDSNTAIGGDDCNGEKGWNTWFRQRFAPASCRSYARSGATWTNTMRTQKNVAENIGTLGDDNVIYNQINRLLEAHKAQTQTAPEVILILAGTNDAWFRAKRPEVYTKTAEQAFALGDAYITSRPANQVLSLAESVRYNCELLMQAFPKAQIVLITPMQSVYAGKTDIEKVGNLIEACGHKMGLSVIRLDQNSSVYYTREKLAKLYTYDGTHTSVEGAKRNGFFIANQLSALLQY